MKALEDAPSGFWLVVQEAREFGDRKGNNGAGLLLHKLRRGDHFEAEIELDKGDTRKVSGWRWVRGSHGESWVRDPQGRDLPPRGWQSG